MNLNGMTTKTPKKKAARDLGVGERVTWNVVE